MINYYIVIRNKLLPYFRNIDKSCLLNVVTTFVSIDQ